MVVNYQCKNCGSKSVKRGEKSIGNRLVCAKCGSFSIGFEERSQSKSKIYHGYKSINSGISQYDWQYIIPVLIIVFVYLATDLFGLLNKGYFIYWSGLMIDQPHRIITSHIVHNDLSHLLANIGGIVVARYFFNQLGLQRRTLFLEFIPICFFLSTLISWWFDIFVIGNPNYRMLGFSGIIYAFDAFILLASSYGKESFLGSEINLRSNSQVQRSMKTLTLVGLVWSFLPGVSLLGHASGFLAGCLLFFV